MVVVGRAEESDVRVDMAGRRRSMTTEWCDVEALLAGTLARRKARQPFGGNIHARIIVEVNLLAGTEPSSSMQSMRSMHRIDGQ